MPRGQKKKRKKNVLPGSCLRGGVGLRKIPLPLEGEKTATHWLRASRDPRNMKNSGLETTVNWGLPLQDLAKLGSFVTGEPSRIPF